MQMSSVWKRVCLYSLSLGFISLAGCAAGPGKEGRVAMQTQLASEPAMCREFRSVWVALFKANVQAMSSETPLPANYQAALETVRTQMKAAGADPQACSKPNCMIDPLPGGKLDSYCGYRVTATQSEELYQWVPWNGQ